MATWDDSESEDEDSKKGQDVTALTARTDEESEDGCTTEAELNSDEENEVHPSYSYSELKVWLLEMLEKHNSLLIKHTIMEKDIMAKSEASKKYEKILSEMSEKYEKVISELSEKNLLLESSNAYLSSKISKLEKEISSDSSILNQEKKYEKSFQHFLAKSIDRSKIASLIYGVSNSNKRGVGHSEPYENHKILNKRPKAMHEKFVPSGTYVRNSTSTHSESSQRQLQKRNKNSTVKPHVQIPLKYHVALAPKVQRTSGKKTNKRGPRRWVPKSKIILLADILSSSSETPVMVPGRWMLVTHKGRRAYVPRSGT